MMLWYGGHWAWWEAGVMWVVMIAFWGVVIWLVYYLVVGIIRGGHRQDGHDRASEILDERLAKGEIDVEEYRRLHDELGKQRSERTGAPR